METIDTFEKVPTGDYCCFIIRRKKRWLVFFHRWEVSTFWHIKTGQYVTAPRGWELGQMISYIKASRTVT
jgi:hypothetical protein